MKLPVITLVPWLIYSGTLAYLQYVLLQSKRFQKLPRFTLYVLALNLQTNSILVAAALGSAYWYYWLFVISEPICGAALLVVLWAIFKEVLYPWRTFPRGSLAILLGFAGCALVTGLGLFAMFHIHHGANPYLAARDLIEAVVHITTAVGFITVVVFSDYFGIPWKSWTYGIGLGAVVGAVSDAAICFLPQTPLWGGINSLCWATAAGLWAWYLRLPDTPPLRLSSEESSRLQFAVDQHILAVKERLRKSG